MDLGLAGRVVLVTGGSKGIGLACAKAFAAEGARIAVCSRSHDNVERARAELEDAFAFVADLAGRDDRGGRKRRRADRRAGQFRRRCQKNAAK
jgi:NAD(P)-dependent dehydrogenase (short-subunit alcohol dehydrogenase family)